MNIKNNYRLIWITTVVVILILIYFVYSNIQKQKQIELLKNSDEQVLTEMIKTWTKNLKDKELLVVKLTKEVSDETLKNNCLKTQLNRLFEWMEYNINYCNNKQNLIKFVGL